MAAISPERVASTMKLLITGNFDMKMLTLRQRPIAPPDDSPTKLFNHNSAAGGQTITFAKSSVKDLDDMIRFFQLKPNAMGAMTMNLKSPAQLPTTTSRQGWVPCWYLPWRSGSIVKLKIPSMTAMPVVRYGNGIADVPNPDLFFTAAISGCSVFAIGDAQSPNTYHGGIDGAQSAEMKLGPNETTEQGWERLLAKARTRKQQGPERIGSVGKTDYVAELNPNATSNGDRIQQHNQKTTAKALELEDELIHRGRLTIHSVAPWGAVFALRDKAHTWHFNLVRNATVIFDTIALPPNRKQRLIGAVKSLLPGSKGGHEDDDGYLTGAASFSQVSGVNLGYQEFFPGHGQALYRDLKNVMIV